jgi:cytochrome c-type biogenesis protein CcmH/NrfG
MLGFIHGRLGDEPAAERAYRRAITLDPDAERPAKIREGTACAIGELS